MDWHLPICTAFLAICAPIFRKAEGKAALFLCVLERRNRDCWEVVLWTSPHPYTELFLLLFGMADLNDSNFLLTVCSRVQVAHLWIIPHRLLCDVREMTPIWCYEGVHRVRGKEEGWSKSWKRWRGTLSPSGAAKIRWILVAIYAFPLPPDKFNVCSNKPVL